MRERGAERQRGPGQLRIVVQLRFERNKLHTPGYVSQTLFPFLCSQTITLRVSRPFLQLSPATAAIVMFGMSIWNLSSLSFPSFSFYSKTQPPEQNNCRRPTDRPTDRPRPPHQPTATVLLPLSTLCMCVRLIDRQVGKRIRRE